MSDHELLTVVLMILGIIVSILIAYINHTKEVTAPSKIILYQIPNKSRGFCRIPFVECRIGWGKWGKKG